jgi:hypothetical protein
MRAAGSKPEARSFQERASNDRGREPLRYPALYRGTTDGETMTLRVTRLDTGESVGTFVLALGASPRLFRCL